MLSWNSVRQYYCRTQRHTYTNMYNVFTWRWRLVERLANGKCHAFTPEKELNILLLLLAALPDDILETELE